jgi:hypothetical protein
MTRFLTKHGIKPVNDQIHQPELKGAEAATHTPNGASG